MLYHVQYRKPHKAYETLLSTPSAYAASVRYRGTVLDIGDTLRVMDDTGHVLARRKRVW